MKNALGWWTSFFLFGIAGCGFAQGGSIDITWVTPVAALIALLYVFWAASHVLRKGEGNEKVKDISLAIREGAYAYLAQQYKVVGIFFAVLFVLLLYLSLGAKLLTPFVPFAPPAVFLPVPPSPPSAPSPPYPAPPPPPPPLAPFPPPDAPLVPPVADAPLPATRFCPLPLPDTSSLPGLFRAPAP
ncbi:MAG: sodium/proton-translocating pyrophosphatase, partial [Brevinematales bacterium]